LLEIYKTAGDMKKAEGVFHRIEQTFPDDAGRLQQAKETLKR